MKACESVQNYPSRIREMSNYTVREVKKVCMQTGPRQSGGEEEKKAQQYAAESMQNICDSVEREEFTVSPKAFTASISVSAALLLLCIALGVLCRLNILGSASFYIGIAAAVLGVLSLAVVAGEFILSRKVIDFLFSKKTAENVIFTRNASSQAKRKIVFAGNMDSSYEWRYKKSYAVICALVAAAVINIVINITALFNLPQAADTVMLVVSAVSAVPAIMCFAFINFKSVSQGANSNLTGVFSSLAVLRFMDANNIRFENTEVAALSTSCKECGLRGAEAYAEKHKNDETQTVVIAVDALHEFEEMCVAAKDKHTGTAFDRKTAALIKKAAENAGYDVNIGTSAFITDCVAFSRAGMSSSALVAANPETAGFYHSKLDTADKLSLKAVEAGIGVLVEAAFLYDEQGLKEEY